MIAATNPDVTAFTWRYAASAILVGLILAALLALAAWRARHNRPSLVDRYLARKQREAAEAIDDVLLAAHRGQSTRLTRELPSMKRWS